MSATEGNGVGDLWQAITEHADHLVTSGELDERRARRQREELDRIVVERLYARARELHAERDPDTLVRRVLAGELDPWAAADELLGDEP